MATIQRTPESRVDYLEIFVFVGEQNLPAAERLIETFDQRLERLAEMPRAWTSPPRTGKGHPQFSRWKLYHFLSRSGRRHRVAARSPWGEKSSEDISQKVKLEWVNDADFLWSSIAAFID
jgi:plasmid stabilization system protein ParE